MPTFDSLTDTNSLAELQNQAWTAMMPRVIVLLPLALLNETTGESVRPVAAWIKEYDRIRKFEEIRHAWQSCSLEAISRLDANKIKVAEFAARRHLHDLIRHP
ncbi:hypothetical protein DOTSEDRAFT_21908 [Dothistroma septosporum NZE10]|uniref:Uncharacterized protein n=1 Tax=Dothistroma septosporum (strain NZE10 / CBS 128990) TaxID=675120 RepID=N1Q0Q6_DOTSN|nr:hypothetical protein DOTSEDRAFT_21908 [Dothistroma septosporum NZE10]